MNCPHCNHKITKAEIQTAAALDGLAVCSICSNTYQPKRLPAIGRNSYCPRCKDTGAANRFAVTASRRRKLEKINRANH